MNKVVTMNIDSNTESVQTSHLCKVKEITALSQNTYKIELRAPVGHNLYFKAGQYLQLELNVEQGGKKQILSYSIAHRYQLENPHHIQLFIQNNSEFSCKVIKYLKKINEQAKSIKVILPMGQAYLQSDLDLPHVLIASGSGISKIRCITQEILKQNPRANMKIYWSNKQIEDFYLLNEFNRWVECHENVTFTPILESENKNWQGRTGFIYQVIKVDIKIFKQTQVYLCGSPNMVYGTIDLLKEVGLNEMHCYSDVFEYAPRRK